ncbi:membrane-anchored junction protein isoform X2 [Rhinoderma darwinii]|uniref:membrane-anchored junction protein isoform X2 n=1 Tax=Rhinoderma darwinii TaxID=43563 RepID=UPI003F676A70
MPIKPFSFPLPETRFFHTTKYVYKFKIRYGVHFSSEDTENNKQVRSELLESVRAILANHDHLQPFSTKHFLIFPYKSKWDSASRLRFKHGHKFLQPFPYVFTIYVEPYTIVYDSHVESDGEENSQGMAEKTQDTENCINIVSQITGHSEQLCRESCPTLDHGTGNAGGFVEFLMSFTPLRYLFGRRHSQ